MCDFAAFQCDECTLRICLLPLSRRLLPGLSAVSSCLQGVWGTEAPLVVEACPHGGKGNGVPRVCLWGHPLQHHDAVTPMEACQALFFALLLSGRGVRLPWDDDTCK